MEKKEKQRGGAREGAGRPKKRETKTLSYRVPKSMASKYDKAIKALLGKA